MEENKMEMKKIEPEEYSEDRKKALEEIRKEEIRKEEIRKEEPVKEIVKKPKNKKGVTLGIIEQTLGTNKMTRKELKVVSNLTDGQISGAIWRSQLANGILKFGDGKFFIEK